MMSQNRAADKDRLVAEIDHQVNVKAEVKTGQIMAAGRHGAGDALPPRRAPPPHPPARPAGRQRQRRRRTRRGDRLLVRCDTHLAHPSGPYCSRSHCSSQLPRSGAAAAAENSADWPNVGNDKGGTRYSTLDQINRENVGTAAGRLDVPHRRLPAPGTTIECTPIVVDGVMYVTTVERKVVALDAATGKELWRFDPLRRDPHRASVGSGGVNRGVAYWSDGKPPDGERRIFLGAADGRLISLDAQTGKPDPAFGDERRPRPPRRASSATSRSWPTARPPPRRSSRTWSSSAVSNDEGHARRAGRPAGVRRAHGQGGLALPHRPAAGRVRRRDLGAGDAWKDRGGANPWGGLTRRRRARHRLLRHRLGRVRLLRRRTARATTSSPTARSRSTPAPASGSGTSRRSTTTSGTTTTPARRSS